MSPTHTHMHALRFLLCFFLLVLVWLLTLAKVYATDSRMLFISIPGPAEVLRSNDVLKAKAYVEHFLMWREGAHKVLPFAKNIPLPEGVESMTCKAGRCSVDGPAPAIGKTRQSIDKVQQIAQAQKRITDKINPHSYQTMYGMHLVPLFEASSASKLFEIGLGCGMSYGPGASVALWKELFPSVNLWEAEYNADCVQKSKAGGLLDGIHVVTGDQGNRTTLQGWVAESEGHFDAVIDDGGHKNKMIRTSFEVLWPHVKPGGLYFMEDLQVGRVGYGSDGGVVMSDIVQAWVEQLLTNKTRNDLPLPRSVEMIFCQAEACMLKKAK
eukprot:TRINITY_DN33591_c0_g1_i1.p1 TRINITY_DN33591_c0_g1~~TRINITY_DN33591_c0_g1_i1.p1  ORF type:complete len:325 (+),score=46.30 TRINITY_DN33591_c0_g1_i1:49-1023(+)